MYIRVYIIADSGKIHLNTRNLIYVTKLYINSLNLGDVALVLN